MNIAGYIDHTILKPTTVMNDVKKLCSEALTYQFAAVCVPPPFVKNAQQMLQNSSVKIATVVGFPFGYSAARAKLVELQQSIEDGADELDIVINISALKNGSWSYLQSEMKLLAEAAHEKERAVKVIIESGVLTDDEILKCCEIYTYLDVDYLKTSTGYAETGATLHAVQLMRANLPSHIRIKASGGIKTYETAVQFIEAGASRIGCSAGVAIMQQQLSAK